MTDKKPAPARIAEEAVNALFGGVDGLDASIKAYTLALKAHANTEGIPAPTAHAFVEIIVRQHAGGYVVVVPEKIEEPVPVPAPVPDAPPPPSLDELKGNAKKSLSNLRRQRVSAGVTYKGSVFNGDPTAVNAMVATLMASSDEDNILIRWKTSSSDYCELEKHDLHALLKLMREKTQACFDAEFLLVKQIDSAKSKRALEAIDFNAGWPE